MALKDFFKARKNRLIILVVIFVILSVLAWAILRQDDSYLLEQLNRVFNPNISKSLILIAPFLVAVLLGFLPEIFGSDVRAWFFGEEKDEKEGKEEKPPDTQSPVKDEEPHLPLKTGMADGKFYPNRFLPDLKYFVGRKQLFKDIERLLKKTHRVSIHDISGLGKTFSALKYADSHQDDYRYLFFINAAKEAYLESLAQCGILLDPTLADAKEQKDQAAGFKNWLEKNDNWLVIYDNVDIPADIKPLVPNNLKGDCIFTSNFPGVKNLGKEVGITKLDETDSQVLLFSRAKSVPHQKPDFADEKEQEAFEKIVKEIDGLPISLMTTGAFIAKEQLSFQEYLERFEEEPETIIETEDEFGEYDKKSALKAFTIAIEENTKTDGKNENEKQIAKAVKNLYFVAAYVAPDDIHEEFLRKHLETYFEPFAETDKPNIFWQTVRKKFTEYDLFKYVKDKKTFSTHRLIQKTIQTRLASKVEKEQICEEVLETLAECFPAYDYFNKESCEKYYQHALTVLENADKFIEKEICRVFYYQIANYQELLGNYPQAEALYKRQLEISRKVRGHEHEETATSLHNLACIYCAQGKYDEATALFEQALEIGRKTIGKEHPDYATSLNKLAGVYRFQGRYDEAITLYKEALQITENTIGKNHPNYATSLNDLAGLYIWQGKYDEAISNYQSVLEIYRSNLGEEHPWIAIALNNLALVYKKQGKYEKAMEFYKQASEIDEKTIGKEHPDYAIDLHNLALAYVAQDKNAEALPLLEKAYSICLQFLGEEHPNTKLVKENLEDCRKSSQS